MNGQLVIELTSGGTCCIQIASDVINRENDSFEIMEDRGVGLGSVIPMWHEWNRKISIQGCVKEFHICVQGFYCCAKGCNCVICLPHRTPMALHQCGHCTPMGTLQCPRSSKTMMVNAIDFCLLLL